MNKKLIEYVEKNILPLYEKNDLAHNSDHIKYVLSRSIKFANQFDNLNLDMLYTIAMYHDVAHHVDKDNHELLSAKIFYEDNVMKEFFNDEERNIIREAIIDHRASLEYEPRSNYGKIISSADRTTNTDTALKRMYAYTIKHHPNYSIKELVNKAFEYANKKYGDFGYAKSYVKDEEFANFKKDMSNLLRNKNDFENRFMDANEILTYKENKYLKDVIFNNNEQYKKLEILHIEKLKLERLRELYSLAKPFTIEFTGTQRTGKTTTINNLKEFFSKGGFNVILLEEFTTSKYYKEVFKKINSYLSVEEYNLAIIEEVYQKLVNSLNQNSDILLIDRSINDRQIWNYSHYIKGQISKDNYTCCRDKYSELSKKLIDFLIITYANPLTCVKREYNSGISLENKKFINEANVQEFNDSMFAIRDLLENSVEDSMFIDTTNKELSDVRLDIVSGILPVLKRKYK